MEDGWFRLKGDREAVNGVRCRELLNELGDRELPRQVSFSGKSFDLEAAKAAEEALLKLATKLQSNGGKSIEQVDFSDVIAGQKEGVAMAVLRILAESLETSRDIVHVDLSNNSLGMRGLTSCEALLRNRPNLRRLYMSNNGLGEDASRVLKQLFKGPRNFEVLHFQNNLLQSAGALQISHIIAASPGLQELVMASTRIGRVGAMAIGQSLRNTKKLVKLDLSDNTFGEEGGETLALALEGQKNLRVLNLRDTSIMDSGAVLIARALETGSDGLESLDLSGNEITAEAAEDITACIRNKRSLRCLEIEENELGSKGAIVIARALSPEVHTELETVNFGNNLLGDSAATQIGELCKALPALRLLHLNANRLSVDVISRLLATYGDRLGKMDDNVPPGPGEDVDEDIDDASTRYSDRSSKMSDVSSRMNTVDRNSESAAKDILDQARSLKTELLNVRQDLSQYSKTRSETLGPPLLAASRRPVSTRSARSSTLSASAVRRSMSSRTAGDSTVRPPARSAGDVRETSMTTSGDRRRTTAASGEPRPAIDRISTERNYYVAAISNVLILIFCASLVFAVQLAGNDVFYVRPL